MTVGYGDAVPQTIWGRLVAVLTMLASVIILALPISVRNMP
jgi:voltage-gated potassium channel